MKKKIESYQGAAGGWGAVKSVANAVRKQMDIRQDVIAMFDMNKPEGFDCPGCAWPDPKHSASFDICENGAKAIAWEVTDKQVNASFFAENTVQSLLTWGDHELEAAGRLTQPLKYDDVSDCYKPLSWQQAFDEIGARLQSYSDPNQVEFYTSGRTSNEAAFLYQLFAREYGSNNFPDCSNMCHEPTSVGLAASIGVGKGTVLLEDFEKCDLVICIGHNPGTNHPRMLTSLRALVKRGAKMIAINPLQERGLERFTAPQNPFEMLTNSETQLASAYYNVRIGGDMALLKGMMRLLIERDDAASAAGRPSLLDDEFIQTHTVGFDELRRDVLNSEWKDIERISGLSQTQIAELADAYAAAERTIICYGMGITQHEHGTQNVQQLVNLLLMKGNIGKPGAGICPLRGHSNVQGDRTVGITEKPSAEFLYPTALDAADISIPKDLKLDGVSLLPWLQDKKQGEPHKNLTWITSYSHWFDEENIPFWDNYHKFVRHQSDDYPHNPNTEDLSQFSYTVRNNDYSLVYTVENNQLGLYKLTDLQQKDNLAAANPQVVKEMQGVVREFIDNSQPPLSEVNQEKFNNIKKALSEAK
ncbi:TPA: FdhF/YdeP family oxidoreductase [Escherichia coli]